MRAVLCSVFMLVAGGLAHADPAPTGTISGTVGFEGEPPERAPLDRHVDPVCAKSPRLAEDIMVAHGKLRDVLVRITEGAPGAMTQTRPPPTTPVVIDQRDCMYSPRVVGVVLGQPLAIRNSDNTFHNVRGTVGDQPLWNKPQPAHAADLQPTIAPAADDVIELHCDVHAWMHAYAVVSSNPFFAVTGDDGAFTITGLPLGTYTLESWHPVLGTRKVTVKVGAGAKGKVNAHLAYKSQDLPAAVQR